MKLFRKPKLTTLLAMLFLFFSCNHYELNRPELITNNLYDEFITSNAKLLDLDLDNFNHDKSLSSQKTLLALVNTTYKTDLNIPDNVLKAMVSKKESKDIQSFVVKNNLLTKNETEDLINFVYNTKSSGFENAITNLDKKVTFGNENNLALENHDNLISVLKISNNLYPNLFTKGSLLSKSNNWIDCLVSFVLWICALISFVAGCATVFLCAVATIGLGSATVYLVLDCGGAMEN